MRAAIYLRQSLDNTEGIERQRDRCRALAVARDWEVVEEFEDNAVSASKSRERAEWAKMLERAKAGEFDVIVSTKLDRLARRVRDVLDLQEIGVSIATLENDIDTTTASGRFQAQLLAALAELEANRKGERHKDAHVARAARGIPRTTKRPYGWKADGQTLEPEEAEHLRLAIQNVLAGGSLRAEVKRMNDAGARTPVYKSGSGGQEWTTRTLVSVLDRPRMAGINTYLGEVTEHSTIEPVVSVEDWEAYRAIRKDPTRLTREGRGKTPLAHFLSGVPVCTCGETLSAQPVRSRGKSVDYYTCRKGKGKGHVAIAAHLLEVKAEAYLYGMMSGGYVKPGDTGEKVKALRERLATIAEEQTEATDLMLTKGVDKARVRTRLAELAEEATTASAELEAALSADLGAEWLEKLNAAGEDSAESATEFLAWFKALPVETQRALVRGNMTIHVQPGQGSERAVIRPR
ncbi:hypothetical protein DOE76_13870 [Leifsonia sp. ku-ls]|nr:hypothetical protein DOE76_13870 [Leifsonia sp. ku-ls]